MKIFQPIVTSSLNVSDSVIAKSFSGSFSGSGADLYNIPASGITGLNLSQISSGTVSASISQANGLQVNTDTTITGALTINQSSIKYNLVNANAVATWEIFNQATGSHTSAFVKYTVSNGTNSRAGEFITNWNNTSVEYTDISTKDIGNTSGVVFTSLLEVLDPSKIVIRAAVGTSGWTIKALATFI